MPLIIDYRPVKLPPEALAPRRVVAPVVERAADSVVALRPTPNPSRKREGLQVTYASSASFLALAIASSMPPTM